MANLSIQMNGEVIEKLKRAGPKVQDRLADAVKQASTAVTEESIRQAPGVTGKLRQSIRRDLKSGGLKAEIYPSVQYGARLHGPFIGGGRNSDPYLIPAKEAQPGGSLHRWGQKKGINPWAVRASIAKKGVKYNKFLKRAAENSSGQVQRIFSDNVRKIVQFLAD